jgi:hypothetical protein
VINSGIPSQKVQNRKTEDLKGMLSKLKEENVNSNTTFHLDNEQFSNKGITYGSL